MTKYIKKHRYISSDEIGILRESKDCTKNMIGTKDLNPKVSILKFITSYFKIMTAYI